MTGDERPRGEWPIVIGFGVVLVALVAVAGLLITHQVNRTADREVRRVAVQRAQLANELATGLPGLTPLKLRSGFTGAESAAVTEAVERLSRTQPLVGISIFDRDRRLVYPAGVPVSLRLPKGMDRALAGSTSVEEVHYSDEPVLEAAVPIHAANGDVIGVLAVDLDENELREETGHETRRLFAWIVGAAVVLWLLLLPFLRRLARAAKPYLSLDRRRAVRAVKHALATDAVEVHYQPKVFVADGAPCGAEALVRVRSHGRLLAPGEFLRHIEGTRLLRDLTRRVLDCAAADAVGWRARGHDMGVAVNLAPDDLTDALPALVEQSLARHGLDAHALTLEVTELAVLDDPEGAMAVLDRLVALGVTLSLDDFGTGHSSLVRLDRFPVREVKIDRSFISRMAEGDPVPGAIATLAGSLGLSAVAEGVEDAATLELLRKTECQAAQGFLFCRPVPLDELMEWLAGRMYG